MSTILFDLRKEDYPKERGSVFRTLQIYECGICGSTTNKVCMGGWPGLGVRSICPNASQCWHHELEDKLNLTKAPHPKTYLEELTKEIEEIKTVNASSKINDVEGRADHIQKSQVTNTRSYRRNHFCKHEM